MSRARGKPFVKISLVISHTTQAELDELGTAPAASPFFECGGTYSYVCCGLNCSQYFRHTVISENELIAAGCIKPYTKSLSIEGTELKLTPPKRSVSAYVRSEVFDQPFGMGVKISMFNSGCVKYCKSE
jgi:hypothetical protein